ncbi:MFS transporter, partial [Haemophilus seminalis]
IFWTSHGHSVSDAGLFWGISVLVEIVVFFFSTRLFKNWSITALFYLTGIAAIIRWLAFGYADTFVEIILLQCFHSLTYVAGHYATVRYITTQPQTHI